MSAPTTRRRTRATAPIVEFRCRGCGRVHSVFTDTVLTMRDAARRVTQMKLTQCDTRAYLASLRAE